MAEIPSEFVAYPRPTVVVDPAGQLATLAEAYQGINRICGFSLLLNLVAISLSVGEVFPWAGQTLFVVNGIWAAVAAYLQLRKIVGIDKWSEGRLVFSCFAVAITSVALGGIFEFALIQSQITTSMKGFGVRTGFLGPSMREIEKTINALRQNRAPQPFGLQTVAE